MRGMCFKLGFFLTFFALGTVAALAQAPTDSAGSLKLVNLETPTILAPNQWDIRGEVRSFSASDKLSYGTIEANTGLSQRFGLILRSSFSRVAGFDSPNGSFRYGGSDLEAQIKYSPAEIPQLGLMGGVSLPNTPAHHDAFGTASAVYAFPLHPVTLYAGAKGVFGKDTTLFGITGGLDYDLSEGFHVVADGALVLTGDNVYSTATGNSERTSLFGAALRYSPVHQGSMAWSVDLGVSNSIGGTTGFELTPSTGGNTGLYASLDVRF